MKAITCLKYGSTDQLQLVDLPKPTPKANEVLVKIYTTAINDYDWAMVRGKPYALRLIFGLFKPKSPIPGMELSGTVEAVGPKVEHFKVGDAVYGDTSEHKFGTFAEYICVNEKALVRKPSGMSFEEATAISHASMLAYQGLIDVGELKDGQQILINGAGGGVGTLGLQIAREYQVDITGVDTGPKLKMMKELGFDQIIDYKKEDFTKNGRQYDLILDAKTNRSPFAYARSLKPGGKYITVGGQLTRLLQLTVLKPWMAKVHKKYFYLVALKANKDLDYINDLFEKGKIKPIIDGPFPLEQVPRCIQYFGEGKHQGKVVISLREYL